MFVFNMFDRDTQKITIESRLKKIKQGDLVERDCFISSYTSFVAKTVAKVTGKYVDVKNSDEYSIALSAFNEAIDAYSFERGNFIYFAEKVIRSRLIDYARKNKKHEKVYPVTYYDEENNNNFFDKHLRVPGSCIVEGIETKEEISEYTRRLSLFGISLKEMVAATPTHQDSIKICVGIAKIVSTNQTLLEKMVRNKCLPLSDLMKQVNVHQRTVERNRKFIIALILIMQSNLDVIKSYLDHTMKGG